MGNINVIDREIETLFELEERLSELLLIVKPSDKLRSGDEFTLENDIYLLGGEEIKKGNTIVIEEINKGGEGQTDKIKYIIKGGKGKTRLMSKWIFMGFFCKDLIFKEDNLKKQINDLKKQIKIEQKKINKKKILKKSYRVKDEVNFLLTLVQNISKALKK